jgi:hypothetical protein
MVNVNNYKTTKGQTMKILSMIYMIYTIYRSIPALNMPSCLHRTNWTDTFFVDDDNDDEDDDDDDDDHHKSKFTYHILIEDFIYTKQIIQTAQKLLLFVTSIFQHSVHEVFALLRALFIGS